MHATHDTWAEEIQEPMAKSLTSVKIKFLLTQQEIDWTHNNRSTSECLKEKKKSLLQYVRIKQILLRKAGQTSSTVMERLIGSFCRALMAAVGAEGRKTIY